jgi:hypothetical protein
MGDQNLLSRVLRASEGTLNCWSRLHLQSLVPTPVSRRVDVRRPVVKIIAESLSQHDEKHVPTPLSGIRGRRRILVSNIWDKKILVTIHINLFIKLHTYIPLTLCPWRGSRDISDPLRRPHMPNELWEIMQTWQVVSLSSDRSPS